MKTRLTVKHICYLFDLLEGQRLIEKPSNVDLALFISSNFTTTKSESLDAKNVENVLSAKTEKLTADYWASQLKLMLQAAKDF